MESFIFVGVQCTCLNISWVTNTVESLTLVGVQCTWIIKILLVPWNIISWFTVLMHCNVRYVISLLYVHGEVNTWVIVTHEICEH